MWSFLEWTISQGSGLTWLHPLFGIFLPPGEKELIEFALCLQPSLGSLYSRPNHVGIIDGFWVGAQIWSKIIAQRNVSLKVSNCMCVNCL